MGSVESGYLLLADLTGYTAYLSRSEIEHAPAIAGDLLETVVGRLEPPFRLAKLEGDAAFLFVEEGRAEPSLLLDALEAAYLAFRRRLRSIEGATSCDCNSCGLAPQLDLKLFLHHGSFVHTAVAGRDELAGADVILVHRLLKGEVARSWTGGFLVLTSGASETLGVIAAELAASTERESVDHIGQLEVLAVDLEQRWQRESHTRRLDHSDAQPILELEASVPVEPAIAWAHLTTPALRSTWEGPITFEAASGATRGVGATTRCVTGRLATIEEIVDWQPYDYVGWRVVRPGLGSLEVTAELEATTEGTRMRLRWCTPSTSPAPGSAVKQLREERTAALNRLVQKLSGRARLPIAQQEVSA